MVKEALPQDYENAPQRIRFIGSPYHFKNKTSMQKIIEKIKYLVRKINPFKREDPEESERLTDEIHQELIDNLNYNVLRKRVDPNLTREQFFEMKNNEEQNKK